MAKLRFREIARATIAVALASASLLITANPANAASALFRAKRTWWFSWFGSWTDGHVVPPSGKGSYQPPAIAQVGSTTPHPAFTAPRSFIKSTTYYFTCHCQYTDGTFPQSSEWFSYWNAKGSFRPQNPNAPTATTTIRFATTMSNPDAPPTAMGDPLTPTTTWGGRYDHSRGGSIVIWPGKNRFGGTLRFFYGPNSRYYQLTRKDSRHYTSITYPPTPLSQQLGTGVEMVLGEVELAARGYSHPLTYPFHIDRQIIGTTPLGGPEYYVRTLNYLVTRAPYTTGKARVWEPNGNTNTIHTVTGYDNRTPAGLNGTISLVHPRLTHTYRVFPASSGKPIGLSWSSARMRKIDFRFVPEPAAIEQLISGLAILASLYRLRPHDRAKRGKGRAARSDADAGHRASARNE